jgi:hypothetical protein
MLRILGLGDTRSVNITSLIETFKIVTRLLCYSRRIYSCLLLPARCLQEGGGGLHQVATVSLSVCLFVRLNVLVLLLCFKNSVVDNQLKFL